MLTIPTSDLTVLDPSNTSLVEAVRRAREEAAALRVDNGHLLVTARQAASVAANERHIRQICANRLNAVVHYLATVDVPDEVRRDVRGLALGMDEPGRDKDGA